MILAIFTFSFVFVFGLAGTEWTEPKLIANYFQSQEFDYAVFTDSSVGVSHIAYCNFKNRMLYYVKITNDGQVIPPVKISTVQFCWYTPDIIGLNDGSNVYIAFYGMRAKTNWFYDSFFLETTDGGKSWSKPIQVPRKSLNDTSLRTWPKVVVNKKTKRIFIFYSSFDPASQNKIMMVTRAPGSSVFSNEKKILDDATLDFGKPIVTTEFDEDEQTIHLYWKHVFDGKNYYIYSKNNGITWSTPRIENLCNNRYHPELYKIFGNSGVDLSTIAGLCGNFKRGYYSIMSRDQGESWRTQLTDGNIIKNWAIFRPKYKRMCLLFHTFEEGYGHRIIYTEFGNNQVGYVSYPKSINQSFGRSSLDCKNMTSGDLRLIVELSTGTNWTLKFLDAKHHYMLSPDE